MVALTGATLHDGAGGAPVTAVTVLLAGGRFAAVGPDVVVPPGAEVLDVAGAHVVPGIVDAHVHLAFAGDPRSLLRGGVTAVRDMGWPPVELAALRAQAVGAGLVVQHTGPILTPPGGYPTKAPWAPPGTGREVATAADARAAVDDAAATGACAVKLAMEDRAGPVFDDRVLAAIVERAGHHGLPTTVHAGSADAVEACLAAGVGELAHVPFRLIGAAPDLARRCAHAGVRLLPTLHCREGDDRGERDAALAFLGAFVAAGGAVAYGTDLGNDHTSPGVDADELRLMQAAGMTPGQVLAAATCAAAAAIGAAHEVGRIAPGLRADLLVLDADPLTDVTALARPRLVLAAGRPVR